MYLSVAVPGFLSGSLDVYSMLLLIMFVAVNGAWLAIFIISIRSHIRTPLIYNSKTARLRPRCLKCSHSQPIVDEKVFPLVTVIVPARNEEKNIENCLLSLMNQDYPQFEIIAVDDNSTDNTLRLMKSLKNKSTRSNNLLKVLSLKDVVIPEGWTGKT